MKNSLRFFGIPVAFLMVGVSLRAQAGLHTEKVQYKQGVTDLVGYLAYDEAIAGKRPGVLVVHEWWGLNEYVKKRAEVLARQGNLLRRSNRFGYEGRVPAKESNGKRILTIF